MASEFLYNYITCKSLELLFEASLWHVLDTRGILKLIGFGCVLKIGYRKDESLSLWLLQSLTELSLF